MNKLVTVILFLLLNFGWCYGSNGINVTILNHTGDSLAYLKIANYHNDLIYESDSFAAKKTIFVPDVESLVYFNLYYNNANTPIFYEGESMTIEIHSSVHRDSLQYYEFITPNLPINTNYQQLLNFHKKINLDAMEIFYSFYGNSALDSTEVKRLKSSYDSLRNYQDIYNNSYIESSQYEELRLYELNFLTDSHLKDPAELKAFMGTIKSEKLREKYPFIRCENILNSEKLAIGSKLSGYNVLDENKNVISLDSLLKPKVNYILFWSTWCRFSLDEMKQLIEYNNNANSTIGFVLICIESEYEEWVKSIANFSSKDIQYYLPLSDKSLLQALWQSGTPYGVMLDHNIVMGKDIRFKEFVSRTDTK